MACGAGSSGGGVGGAEEVLQTRGIESRIVEEGQMCPFF